MTKPANPEQWLTRQIKAGRFRARKVGRQWAMTDGDIADMLDRLATGVAAEPAQADDVAPVAGGLSVASMRLRRRPA